MTVVDEKWQRASYPTYPSIGGIKEVRRVELAKDNYRKLVHHKYNNKEKPIIHDRRECVLEDLRTYVEDYFYLSKIAEKYKIM